MNAFLQGDIDAAQAMTYNEYAQLLETTNPDTGELYQPEDFNVINYEDTEGAMLQDAIWADTERLESDEDYQDTTVKFLKAVIKGWIYAAREPRGGVGDHDRGRLQLGSEPRALDGQRDQQAHLAVARRHRRDRRGRVGQDRRRARSRPSNETGAHLITEEPPATA